MSELIRNKEDLMHYLTTKQIASKEPPSYVYVSTNLRKLVLTDDRQGKFIHNGCVKQFEFKSMGGGVYAASIKENKARERLSDCSAKTKIKDSQPTSIDKMIKGCVTNRYKKDHNIDGWPIIDTQLKLVLSNNEIVRLLNEYERAVLQLANRIDELSNDVDKISR